MKTKNMLLYLCALGVFALDRASKLLWRHADFVLIPRVLAIRATQNTGMAFGLWAGGAQWLAVISAVLLLFAFAYLRRHTLRGLTQTGLGLILGGALGNLFDRIIYGYVIDLFDLLFIRFYIFNIADVGVVLGAALICLCLLKGETAHQ